VAVKKKPNSNGKHPIQKLSAFRPQVKNLNRHTPRGMAAQAKSIQRDGLIGGITVAADNESFDGSGTIENLADFMPDVKIKVVDTVGDTLIVNRRMDIPNAKHPRAKRLGYAANAVPAMNLDWDGELLAALAADDAAIADLARQENASLKALAEYAASQPLADAEPQMDRAEELNKKWKVKTGDLWRINEHRLLCGDCTVRENVERVMAGEKAGAVVTDPPWNVGWRYDGYDDCLTPEKYKEFSDKWRTNAELMGAKLFFVAMSMKNYKHFHLWFPMTERIFAECQNFVQHTGGFMQYAFNPILIWGENGKKSAAGQRDFYLAETSITKKTPDKELAKINTATRWLPTIAYIVNNFIDRDKIIYEPFSGSGTTLVACENLFHRCRAIEISPAYTAVCLERMNQAFPGIEIERVRA